MSRKITERSRRRGEEKLVLRVPRILTIVGEESEANGTHRLSSWEIDRVIRLAREERRKRSS